MDHFWASRKWRLASSLAVEPPSSSIAVLHSMPSLEEEISRFWKVEEIPSASPCLPEDEQCENYFRLTHSRSADERYIVRLPFYQGPLIDVGSSRAQAERVFGSLSKRLQHNADLAKGYSEFLREYEALGHMRRAPDSDSADH